MAIPREFIEKELSKSCAPKRANGSLMIPCPFHEDQDPSLGVSLGEKVSPGVWHCFGCKAKGSWNQLAEKLGLRTWDSDSSEEIYYVNTSLKLYELEDEENLTLEELDSSINWKSYSNSFLKKFGAKKLWHDKYKDYYIYLPITFLYERLGYIRVRLREESYGPKYWFNFEKKPLFPADYILNYETPVIILVEGAADALRLLKYNLPALAILGSSITDLSKEILECLNCSKIILLMDNDNAGRRSIFGYKNGKNIVHGLETVLSNYNPVVVFPKHGKDPDDMPYQEILSLKKTFLEIGGIMLNTQKYKVLK